MIHDCDARMPPLQPRRALTQSGPGKLDWIEHPAQALEAFASQIRSRMWIGRTPGGDYDRCVRVEPGTRVPAGTLAVTNALPPTTEPFPMIVSPPRIVAFA